MREVSVVGARAGASQAVGQGREAAIRGRAGGRDASYCRTAAVDQIAIEIFASKAVSLEPDDCGVTTRLASPMVAMTNIAAASENTRTNEFSCRKCVSSP